jgi:hypothetical protein
MFRLRSRMERVAIAHQSGARVHALDRRAHESLSSVDQMPWSAKGSGWTRRWFCFHDCIAGMKARTIRLDDCVPDFEARNLLLRCCRSVLEIIEVQACARRRFSLAIASHVLEHRKSAVRVRTNVVQHRNPSVHVPFFFVRDPLVGVRASKWTHATPQPLRSESPSAACARAALACARGFRTCVDRARAVGLGRPRLTVDGQPSLPEVTRSFGTVF